MDQLSKLVSEFHQGFSLPHREQPTLIPEAEWKMRAEILREEAEEYEEACEKGDLTAVADALGDQLYVLMGTILSHGLQNKMGEILVEIHRSNMSKLGPDGKPIYREDGKVLKGPGYSPPDIRKFIAD